MKLVRTKRHEHSSAPILGGLANVALVLLVAPFFQGVLRKVTARIQSRQGPPLWQPYFDLLKLLGKEDIESGETPLMQRFAAYLSLATVLTRGLPGADGFRGADERRGRRHPADLPADALRHLHAAGRAWRRAPPTRWSASAAR